MKFAFDAANARRGTKVPVSRQVLGGLLVLLVVLATVALVLGVFVGLPFFVDYSSCNSKARAMGMPVSWGPLQGCMVQTGGRWLPIEALRDIPAAGGAR